MNLLRLIAVALAIFATTPSSAQGRVIYRQHNASTDCFRAWTNLSGFAAEFEVTVPTVMTVHGHADIKHRGQETGIMGVVGYAGALSIFSAPTLAQLPPPPVWSTPLGTVLPGSINGGNIYDRTMHYGRLIWTGFAVIEPGAYRVMAHCNSHTSIGGNAVDGLVEILVEGSKGLNSMIIRLDPLPAPD